MATSVLWGCLSATGNQKVLAAGQKFSSTKNQGACLIGLMGRWDLQGLHSFPSDELKTHQRQTHAKKNSLLRNLTPTRHV